MDFICSVMTVMWIISALAFIFVRICFRKTGLYELKKISDVKFKEMCDQELDINDEEKEFVSDIRAIAKMEEEFFGFAAFIGIASVFVLTINIIFF